MITHKKIILFFWFFYCSSMLGQEIRPLNILVVVHYFPSISQIYILNLITSLIDRGHNVTIFSLRKNDVQEHLPVNVEKYNLMEHVIYEKLPRPLLDCDIVFCQFGDLGSALYEMPGLADWLQQRKVIVCLRGYDIVKYSKSPSRVNKQMFKQADLFLPVCDYFKQQLIGLGCPPERVMVHPSPIDCDQFFFKTRVKPKNNAIKLVAVCRLVKKKGLEFALQAIAKVVKKYPQIHFSIIGDGPEQANLELLVRQLKIERHVTFHGWKNHESVVSILDKSHIFLLPSITPKNGNQEGIANALKEAMAMGLISIGTWHAGTPELIDDGVSGFLVPEKKSQELARKIEYVIQHPEQWESIGLAARKKVDEGFEIKKSAQRLEQLFFRLRDSN